MSRIGKQPIKVPSNVSVEINGQDVKVSGPKGNLSMILMEGVKASQDGDIINVELTNDDRTSQANHGLSRSLLANLVTGVSEGFTKKLEINGVGYRANLAGANLKLTVGFSHDVTYNVPAGINVSVEQNVITVSGIDKQQVGQAAAEIRSIKKPEPYKGKGIKYVDERIIRKSGKSGKEK